MKELRAYYKLFDKLKRNIFVVIGFASLIYFILIIYSDHNLLFITFQKIPFSVFISSFSLIIITISLKFLRWHIYLRQLKIVLDLKNSILIFLSGFIMSISPGKIGELLKAFLIKDKFNISKSRTLPIILAERISEFIALIILSTIGIIIYKFEVTNFVIPFLAIFLFLIIGLKKNVRSKLLQKFVKSSFLKSRINKIEIFNSSMFELFKPIIFIKVQLISLFAWVVEFYCFYIIIDSLGKNVDLVFTTFVYSVSMIIGAVSMLPGGIGTTEASLVYQLVQSGITESNAITTTFVIRIVTLWFSVILGFLAYIIYLKKNDKIL